MRNLSHSLVRPALIWLVLSLSINLFLFWQNMVGAVRVMRNHEVVAGKITQLLPEDHRTVVVSYTVNGQQFKTTTSLPEELGLPPFERLRLGENVNVEYNPAQPAEGVIGSAKRLFASDLKDIGLVAIFLLFGAAYVEFNIRSYLRKSRSRMATVENVHP